MEFRDSKQSDTLLTSSKDSEQSTTPGYRLKILKQLLWSLKIQ